MFRDPARRRESPRGLPTCASRRCPDRAAYVERKLATPLLLPRENDQVLSCARRPRILPPAAPPLQAVFPAEVPGRVAFRALESRRSDGVGLKDAGWNGASLEKAPTELPACASDGLAQRGAIKIF